MLLINVERKVKDLPLVRTCRLRRWPRQGKAMQGAACQGKGDVWQLGGQLGKCGLGVGKRAVRS